MKIQRKSSLKNFMEIHLKKFVDRHYIVEEKDQFQKKSGCSVIFFRELEDKEE